LGVDAGISKSEVSRICAELDADVTVFRSRSLAHTVFPYLLWTPPTSRPAWMAGWSAARW
jgi:hypothetical protein